MKALFVLAAMGFVFLSGAIAMGFHLWFFTQELPAMIMIFGPIVIYLLYAEGVRGSRDLFRRVFSNQATDDDANRLRSVAVLGLMLGALSAITGIIVVMGHLTSGVEGIGNGIGCALVSSIMGAAPSFLLVPITKKAVVDKNFLKIAAGFAGLTVLSNLSIIFFTLWICK